MRDKYTLFEEDLFNFVLTKTDQGYIILFPPSLDAHFVNASKITLKTTDVYGAVTTKEY